MINKEEIRIENMARKKILLALEDMENIKGLLNTI